MNKNIIATILVVIAVGIYFTYSRGMLDAAQSVQSVNNQYIAAIDNAEKLIKVRDQVLNDYNNISADDKDRLNKMLPSAVDNIRLVIDMNSIAVRHGFTLKNISAVADSIGQKAPSAPAMPPSALGGGLAATRTVGPKINPVVLDSVTVSFGVTAPYEQFISLLQDLEANLRIMDLTHLTVSANDTGTYDFAVTLKTYWLRQQ